MYKPDPRLLEIAASVADGRPVAWEALLAETPVGDLREALRALETLGRMKAVHASSDRVGVVTISTPPETATLNAGSRLGRYEIVESIGAGGMGEVYRARDTQLPREVAIKVLRLGSQGSAVLRKRLEREARVAARLSHPNICTLHDFGRDGEIDFLVMEYLEGETLYERLRHGPLELNEAVRLGTQIASALAEAHRQGVIHRDLKPANVMLTGHGEQKDVQLLDFGIAKWQEPDWAKSENRTEEPLTLEGRVVGTTAYMSPEQIEGTAIDGRSDLFSFGAVLFEMLTGKPAFSATSQARLVVQILEHDPPRLPLATGAPPHLSHLIDRCFAKDPEDRWQTASDVMHELQWTRDGTPESLSGVAMQASGRAADRLATNQRATVHLPAGKRATLLLGSLAATVAALYLNNPSLPDALLYPLLAVIGALPLILLVAALAGLETRAAASRIIEALGSFGGMAPQTPEHGRRRTLGVALGLFLGAVLSVLLSYAADQLMPKLRFIPHPDNENSVWALNDPNGDWKTYRTRYKSSFLSHTGATEADWQTQKHSLGRGSVRVARTLFGFSLLLGLAGAADVIRRRYRRGFPVLIAALTVSLILYSTWYDREGNYVTEMISASGRLPESLRPQLPASAPDALQRLVADRAP